ncbi:hypothetical protein ES754_00320 [Psychrobacter frigidicola]|uniref:Uncharacterized protein n=1 Tax=Psychrobacter frigidicola TaxID=45611 RepID=A0A5C7A474_9GAMM|nr:hypothetical protein [Psychrobacter frigidicola]TXD97475.1 hypothetical protein ES754_00320 [Psychrobacter frigidicola]
MSILLGVGVVTTVTVIYLGKKGWQALHRAVGITPGVLIYKNPNEPLSLLDVTWQNLALNVKYLNGLPDEQLRQLQRIDNKVTTYKGYQRNLQEQNLTEALTEQEFVLHKLLHTRLPEMLTSHHHVRSTSAGDNRSHTDNINTVQANEILQEVLDNIEERLDNGLERMETQHLQDLRIMKRYIDSHNA